MYGGHDAMDWIQFWIFAGSVAVIATAWDLARKQVLARTPELYASVIGR
jgi:hypothetical protein